jgi:crotonobetainyl-CoA:carnitine CoA-transferase CaiB-like acyl-CoA transferase
VFSGRLFTLPMHPLNGIRVLDLSRLVPGLFSTMLLAHLGAEEMKEPQKRGIIKVRN